MTSIQNSLPTLRTDGTVTFRFPILRDFLQQRPPLESPQLVIVGRKVVTEAGGELHFFRIIFGYPTGEGQIEALLRLQGGVNVLHVVELLHRHVCDSLQVAEQFLVLVVEFPYLFGLFDGVQFLMVPRTRYPNKQQLRNSIINT